MTFDSVLFCEARKHVVDGDMSFCFSAFRYMTADYVCCLCRARILRYVIDRDTSLTLSKIPNDFADVLCVACRESSIGTHLSHSLLILPNDLC